MAGDDRFWPWGYELSKTPHDWQELDGVWKTSPSGDCRNHLGMKTLAQSNSSIYPDVKLVLFDPVTCRALARGLGRAAEKGVTLLMSRLVENGGRYLRSKDEAFGLSIRDFGPNSGLAIRSFSFLNKSEPPVDSEERVPSLIRVTSLVYTDGSSVSPKRDTWAGAGSIRAVIPCDRGFLDF